MKAMKTGGVFGDKDFLARRAKAKARLDSIDPTKFGLERDDPNRRAWFEAVYNLADGDIAHFGLLLANLRRSEATPTQPALWRATFSRPSPT